MKKILLGLIIGVVVALPVGAFAWSQQQMARPIVGADCRGPYKVDKDGYYIKGNNNELVKDPTGTNGDCSVTVYVFDNANNKCYVVKGSNASGISCVKDNQ